VQACVALAAAHEGCAAHSDEFFPFLPDHVAFDPASDSPFVFRHYNKSEVVLGKTMGEWIRPSIAFWHTFRGDGSDPFGAPTKARRLRSRFCGFCALRGRFLVFACAHAPGPSAHRAGPGRRRS